jgi:tetratricopeptide (TPR) repeat protein
MGEKPEDRFSDAGRMYEALLAFLYSQGRRFSAHDLADFLGRFRSPDETGPHVVLDAEGIPSQERTPVEVPNSRRNPSVTPSVTRVDVGVPLVDVERATAMGERREVTALVIEVPGIREGATPAVETTLAERAARTIARYGGRIHAREPETITALFGLEDPDGRDTEVATRCALVVLRSLAGVRQPSAGLHVGRIHVQSDGTPTEDDRLGSLVATARDLARVREGMCAISAAAMRQVRTLFVFDQVGEAHTPAGLSSSTTFLVKEVRGPSEAVGRFVGRKDELRVVGEMLANATRRTATALTVRGDHGVGKTRLLLEVERRLRKGGYNVGWHIASCLPRGTELPYTGIQCMLQVLCGVAEGDPEPRIRQVVPRLRALGLQDDEVSAVLTALGAAAQPQAAASGAKASLVNAFTRMVSRLCEDRPHAFAWDSAHSMDADSWAVLEAVLARIPSARVLFVLSARGGFTHPIERLPIHAALDLVDLRADDAERLVGVRLGVERVPAELLRFVRDRAGGHPQMIEEVIKALVAARAVTVADGSVVSMKLVGQDLALPKTLRGLVASRIARLAAADRTILQAASALGDPVNSAVLAQMTSLEMGTLERSIATLKERGFLVHTGPQELRFTSPVFREVVLDAITVEAAREMHAAAGLALEKVHGARALEHAGQIATHLYEAGERERAATYFGKSAERHLEVGRLEAATRDYARAIELCDLDGRNVDEVAFWFAGLAKAVRLVRSLPEAIEICERVTARVDAAPKHDVELRVKTRIDAGRILGALHMYDAARAQFAAAEAIAQDRPELAKSALVAAAELTGRQGDFKRSLTLLERMQSMTIADKQEEFKLLVSLAQTNAAMGDHAAAMRYYDRLDAFGPSDKMAICERSKLMALITYFASDFRAAAAHSEKVVDLARDLGLQYEVAMNLHNLGDILVHIQDYPRAYGAVKQSLALCDELGFERLASHDRMYLAFLDGLAGQPDADKVILQGIRYAEANEFTWDVLGGRLLLAKLLEHRGESDAARLEYQKLRDLARAAGNRLVADDCVAALRAMGGQDGAPPSQPPPSARA